MAVNWYKIFSKELSLCYFMQNENLTDSEMSECYEEDKTIIEGILMGLLMEVDELEELEDLE